MTTKQLSTKQIVNLISDPVTGTAGEIYFNTVLNEFKYYNGSSWIPFSSGNIPVGGNAGDILAKIDDTDYNVEWIQNYTSQLQHIVKAAESISKGQAAYVSSATGTNMLVSKASNDAELTSSKTLGIIAQDLATNDQGFIISEGLLSGLNTSTATVGDPIWLGTSGNLIFGLTNKPTSPHHLVYLGVVTRVHAINGEIFVKVQNGYELEELHDVSITSIQDKDTILYDTTTGTWKNNGTYLLNTSSTSQTKDGNLTLTGTATAETFDLNETNITSKSIGVGSISPIVIDSFDSTVYRTVEYLFQLSQGSNYTTTKLLVIHNDSDSSITEFATLSIGSYIDYIFSTAFNGNNIEISVSCPTASDTTVYVKSFRTLFDK